jgi:hypothetical protein
MGTGLDVFVAGNCVGFKTDQDPHLMSDYHAAFAPD